MLKFPRSLDEIDPLPRDLSPNWCDWDLGLDTRASNRHKQEWDDLVGDTLGIDWKPIPGRPYWFRNGKGQLRYAPPLPSNPPKQTKPTPYAWVRKRLPKLGDKVTVSGWGGCYYEVIHESDNHVVLFDPKSGASAPYPKIRSVLDWEFEDEAFN